MILFLSDIILYILIISMRTIETVAQFNEDGTVILKVNQPIFIHGKHKVLLVIDDISYSIPLNNPNEEKKNKRKSVLLNSPIWNDEQYENWSKDKQSLYGWFQ
jgi:hypothetical protein